MERYNPLNRLHKNNIHMKNNEFITAAVLLLYCCGIKAQGTIDDYNRAYAVKEKYSAKNIYNGSVNPSWIEGTHCFWYVNNEPSGKAFMLVDADKKKKSMLFDHTKLARLLSEKCKKEVKSDALDLQKLRVNQKRDTLTFIYDGKKWAYDIQKDRLSDNGPLPKPVKEKHWMETDDEKEGEPVISPDGKYKAYIKNSNIYVCPLPNGQERQVSIDGTDGNYYSSYISWSPDSRNVAACKIRPSEKRYVYYIESSPADQLQPKLHKQEYAKPGDELPFRIPCVFEVESGKAIIPATDLFSSQYFVTSPQWDADSKAITFEYNQRGHQVYRILEMNVQNGQVRSILEEKSDKYVNYPRYFRHDMSDGKRFIWMSERDNWNHLYMFDRESAKPVRQITKGEWYVRDVLKVDEKNGYIYFSANGVRQDEDPYFMKYYRISLDGENLICLTPDKGNHTAWFSDDMKYVTDVCSTVKDAPVATLRDAGNGKEVMKIEEADIRKLLAEGWKAPEVFTAKGRDNKTDMWGVIYRPSNFDPLKKYPIIEYIYQGPGNQYVPKSFNSYNRYMTALAELGFIVVMVDGMGTSFRSREFENVCYKNLKDAGLPDHIAWIKAVAQKYPYMDIERVGIYGCSAGGQESTTAVLSYPDFYKAAYSACGCHDNRMDKIWWNELWLGYPIGNQYKEGSNVENAHLLRRPLMLVVGEMDDNVDPASTMQVANALIKANKDFELVVIPGAHHTMGEDFGEHKRYDFFVRHLLNKTPPTWDKITY